MKVEITRYKSGERKGEIKKCDVQVEYSDVVGKNHVVCSEMDAWSE